MLVSMGLQRFGQDKTTEMNLSYYYTPSSVIDPVLYPQVQKSKAL